jgi:hypothetical protein
MVDDQDKDTQERQTSETPDNEAERDELTQAAQQFFRSLFRAGVQLALVPVNMLPPEPREHFKAAGREFTRGLATLAREIANDVEKIVEEEKEV